MYFEMSKEENEDIETLTSDEIKEFRYRLREFSTNYLAKLLFGKKYQEQRNKTDICEAYAKYIADNSYRLITRTDLRSLHYINNNKFKAFFDKNFEEIKNRLKNYGYELVDYEYKRNMKAYKVVKLLEV